MCGTNTGSFTMNSSFERQLLTLARKLFAALVVVYLSNAATAQNLSNVQLFALLFSPTINVEMSSQSMFTAPSYSKVSFL
jgi:hypothetical protein